MSNVNRAEILKKSSGEKAATSGGAPSFASSGGTLYIVATPIGNLADITLRALDILKFVDIIACEDTRTSRKLLNHYGINGNLVSYNEHNHEQSANKIIAKLQDGKNIALISDAGTPVISDPGKRLVKMAIDNGLKVCPIPGASAVIAALSANAFADNDSPKPFTFAGFPPAKQSARARFFADLRPHTGTIVLYESPNRLLESLYDINTQFNNPEVTIAREITKIYEEFIRGTAAQVIQDLSERGRIKGEIVILINNNAPIQSADVDINALLALKMQNTTLKQAVTEVVSEYKLNRKEVYKMALVIQGGQKSGGHSDVGRE
jgi:16S rRNA (cytidine1402-2'-O)-methyltransferase